MNVMNNIQAMISGLNLLLTRNYDAEKGFTEAAQKIRNPVLKDFFQGSARQRYDFGHSLKDEIEKLGGEPETGSSFKADLHRGWINLREVISSNNAAVILEECERGEEAALKDYRKVLQQQELTPSSRQLVERQEQTIFENKKHVHKLIRNFKN